MNEDKVQELIEPKIKEEFELTEIKRCCGTELVYFDDRDCCEADLLGKDKNNKLYAFQVKKGGNFKVDNLILKVIKYKNGANYSYAILEKDKYPEYLNNLLKNNGIGLITYKVTSKELKNIKIKLKSEESSPRYVFKTRKMFESLDTTTYPTVYIFPNSKDKFPKFSNLKNYIDNDLRRGEGYHHTQVRDTPPGSIILFAYDKEMEIIGEGVVKSTTTEKVPKGYRKTYFFDQDLLRVYNKKIPIDDLKDLPTFMESKNIWGGIRYPSELAYSEYFQILRKIVKFKG